jgi:hypothetical protein
MCKRNAELNRQALMMLEKQQIKEKEEVKKEETAKEESKIQTKNPTPEQKEKLELLN